MAQWVPCPQCDQHYQFPETAAGKQVVCPKCGRLLTVGAAAPAPIPAPPPLVPLPAVEADQPMWVLPVQRKRRKLAAAEDAGEDQLPEVAQEAPREKPLPGSAPEVYVHKACGGKTRISADVVARMTGDPFGFISATWCAGCQRYVGLGAVAWDKTGETVAAYRARLRGQTHPLLIGLRFVGGPLVGTLIAAAIGAAVNPKNMDLGILAGVVIGLPLGYFVGGIAFQLGWWMSRRK